MASRIAWRSGAILAALALLPRCACDTVPSGALEKCSASQVFAGHVKTDILFVIDDSQSMTEEQANLSTNLGAFIDRLATLPIQDDYQIGVITTDVDGFGGGTTFTGGPESGNPYPRGAIVAVTQVGGVGQSGDLVYNPGAFPATNGWGGSRILTKGSPTLIQDFKANVLVGISGSGKEQPFRAVRMALTDRMADGTNTGFLRPGAALAVVIVSDEDDCSDSASPQKVTSNTACHDPANKFTQLDPVGDFAAFLQAPIQGEVRDSVVAAIVGVGEGTLDLACVPATCCTTAFDRADRTVALLQAMGPRSRLASICDASFSKSLEDFANAIMSDTLPLDGTPADWHMLVASVTKPPPTGKVSCKIVSSDSPAPDIAAADAIYSPPQAGRPASLTFQGACSLSPGDRIDVGVVCAG